MLAAHPYVYTQEDILFQNGRVFEVLTTQPNPAALINEIFMKGRAVGRRLG